MNKFMGQKDKKAITEVQVHPSYWKESLFHYYNSDIQWQRILAAVEGLQDGKRKIDRFEAEGTSGVAVNNNRGSTGALTASERADVSGSATENLNAKVKDMDQFESVTRLLTLAKLSRVFCTLSVFLALLSSRIMNYVYELSQASLAVEKFYSAAAAADSYRLSGKEFQHVLCARLVFQS
ncbi:unnamed protein product [Dovyalis caffra]|uniref:Uncharacterized protein n=1 Tax=Dovyalis caffra TaxID=77055 RepID=A0AAV1S465_9ROSI|nr:unnamed protein product [Dovyalis caffra]